MNDINKKALAALVIFTVIIIGTFIYGNLIGTSQPFQYSNPLVNPTQPPTQPPIQTSTTPTSSSNG